MSDCIVIGFAPDRWGSLEWFQHFYVETYSFDHHTQQALAGAANHFNKALTLLRIAREHASKLPEDDEQLEKYGYTPARRGKELSALVESVLLDLYSSVDCTRKVVTFVYKKHRGVKNSTRKFFHAIAKGKVSDTVPVEIRNAFANAVWYTDFMKIRDALTHSDIGSCHLSRASGKVSYTHAGLGTRIQALVIEDIFAHIEGLVDQVNQFMGGIFYYLSSTLKDDEVLQTCGIFSGRIYTRWVRPSEARDFDSGRCDAYTWFEKEENPDCPFMQRCEAYSRKDSGQV